MSFSRLRGKGSGVEGVSGGEGRRGKGDSKGMAELDCLKEWQRQKRTVETGICFLTG